MLDNQKHQYLNIVDHNFHNGKITLELLEAATEGFTKPALFRKLAPIDPKLKTEEFFQQIDGDLQLQWRTKSSDSAVTMRGEDGESDYNYVTGKIGTGKEFLDDLFSKKLDVYSHLGTISSGYSDPYPWGKLAFNKVKESIFSNSWFDVPNWVVTGHIFLGNSTQEYGEPSNGAVGSDWHMFPTLNIFVMVAGEKKWSTRPPEIGDQYEDYDLMFSSSSGREAPGADFEADTFTLQPGDVLINPPFEWHKVLNAKGLSIGAAFRVIDKTYLKQLEDRKNLDLNRVDIEADFANNEELAHFLTSVSYASKDLKRSQMLLNDIEYAYLRKKGSVNSIEIGHK
ncbi:MULTISPECIES: cupin domain-containing protein [Acinetobacter]|uniref:JmjC domain-containing protein n=1 Tax=Acinetobacter indicus TaxID=756892 RepID=A0A6C0Y6I1_9GAMM|nr:MULTISPECIES: hypothetical protein [Acinetobacter]QIC71723.1 hypothetical protein FSC09_15115 [Acinetobacter indicus]QKQ71631.1 hypothetical protein E5Y90_15480 [Acinetobacter sp. 10FS3-1]